jgi:predicted nucleic acid-binding protein
MSDRAVFVDTNILVYAHDTDAGDKGKVAARKLTELWDSGFPASISVQVLQELYVNLLRKGVTQRAARETVSDYFVWQVIDNDRTLFAQAMEEQARWKLSFWDASILAAARRAAARVLWSEDFSPGQDYGGVVVVNPLAASSEGVPAAPDEGA